MPKRLKKLSEQIVFQSKWSTFKHDKYEKPNGEEGDYYYLDMPGVSMIIPVMPDGRIAMVIQSRYLADKQAIQFPAGGITGTAMETAEKELLAETGGIASEWAKVGEFEPSPGLMKDKVNVFICKVERVEEQQLEDTEDIEVIYRYPQEIEEMIIRGDIWCGQTLASWALARHHLLKEE